MSLLHRARVLSATQNKVPAEDVLRFAHPAFHLPVLRSAFAAGSSHAASDGLKFVAVLSEKSKVARPASRWKQSVRPPNETPPAASGHAAGVLEEIATVMSRADEARRPSVLRGNILTFQSQRWYLRLGTKLYEQLVPSLSNDDAAIEQWLAEPFQGTWPFPLSCKGRKVSEPVAESEKPVQSRRPTPGCPACRRRVLMVICGVTQLARRLQVLDDSDCKWLLRATHNSDEVRYPSDKRRSTCTSARRLVRGSPDVDASEDFWPGNQARSRPPASCPRRSWLR